MKTSDRHIKVFDKKIFVRELIVNEENPTIIFLHEGLGATPMWRDFPEKLVEKTGFNGFIYDRKGYGRSDKSTEKREDNYLHIEAEIWLPEIIKTAGLKEIVLLGHSDGGSIALLYGSENRVRGIITEAAHVFVEDVTIRGIEETVKLFNETDLKVKLEKYHGEKTEKVFYDWSDIWLSESFRGWNIEDCLPRIKSPLLVIQGEDDEYATKKQVESIIKKSGGKTCEKMIPHCRHTPHIQAEETVIEHVLDFLEKL